MRDTIDRCEADILQAAAEAGPAGWTAAHNRERVQGPAFRGWEQAGRRQVGVKQTAACTKITSNSQHHEVAAHHQGPAADVAAHPLAFVPGSTRHLTSRRGD